MFVNKTWTARSCAHQFKEFMIVVQLIITRSGPGFEPWPADSSLGMQHSPRRRTCDMRQISFSLYFRNSDDSAYKNYKQIGFFVFSFSCHSPASVTVKKWWSKYSSALQQTFHQYSDFLCVGVAWTDFFLFIWLLIWLVSNIKKIVYLHRFTMYVSIKT